MAKMPRRLQKYSVMQLILAAVIIVGILAVGLMGKRMMDMEEYFQAEKAKDELLYQSLNDQIAAYGGEVGSGLEDGDEITSRVYNATTAGVAVANYQTAFTGCYSAVDQTTALQKNISALQPYFDDNEKLPDGGIVGYMPWFICTRAGETPVWSFKTTYSFSSNVLPVLWECRNSQNELLAFCYGEYVGETGLFKNTKVMMTANGEAYGNPYEDTAGPDVIENMGGIPGYDPSDPSTLPEGYTLNEDGTITDPNGNIMRGAGFDETQVDMWDGTPAGSEDFKDEIQDMLDQRQDGLNNGPSQAEIDANNALKTDGNTGETSDGDEGGWRGSDGVNMEDAGTRDPADVAGGDS